MTKNEKEVFLEVYEIGFALFMDQHGCPRQYGVSCQSCGLFEEAREMLDLDVRRDTGGAEG